MAVFQILLFCILFPCSFFIGIKKKKENSKALISKEQSRWLKGFAGLSVVLGHYILRLTESGLLVQYLKIAKCLGTIGVGIFFFVSGYGIFVSHKFEKQNIKYIVSKLINLFFPYWCINIVELIIKYIEKDKLTLGYIARYIIGIEDVFWFLWIISAMYLLYFIVSRFTFTEKTKIIVFSVVLLIFSLALFFAKTDAWWYRNNVFFVLGILAAFYREKIRKLYSNNKAINVIIPFGIFILGTGIYIFINNIIGSCILTAAVIMLLVYMCNFFEPNKFNFCRFVGNTTLYMYIIHTFIYFELFKYVSENSILWNATYFIVVIIMSLISFMIFDKINIQRIIKRKESL